MLVNGAPGNTISIRDRGLLYGDGVFRTLRVERGTPRHWPLHYRKLQHDCAALGIACPDETVLSAELDGLAAHYPDGIFKLIVTRGQGARGYAPPAQAAPVHLWDVAPLPDYPSAWVEQGVKAHLCNLRLGHQPRLAGVKHLNRLENVLAAAEWSESDAAEGVLLDTSGNVIEGTRSNLFIVKDGVLRTPDLSQCGVAGIQRERVLAGAAEQGMLCRVEPFKLPELLDADEIFLTNSVIGIWPVRQLHGQEWLRHPVARQLREWLSD